MSERFIGACIKHTIEIADCAPKYSSRLRSSTSLEKTHFSWHRAYYPTHFMGHPKGAHVGDDTAEHATKAQGTGCTHCTACSPKKLCNRQFAPLSAPIPNCQPAQSSQPAQPIASRLNPKTIYSTPANCPPTEVTTHLITLMALKSCTTSSVSKIILEVHPQSLKI